MNENSEQKATQDFLQSSELTARLLRRATSSPGVIDTTMLRQVLSRVAGWGTHTASLFDDLMSRYSIDDGSIDADNALLMEQPWAAHINAYLTNNNTFSSTINQFISSATASQSSTASEANFSSRNIPNPAAQTPLQGETTTLSPAMKFRISRSPARRAWDAAPVDASDIARRPLLNSTENPVLKSAEDSNSTASEETRSEDAKVRLVKATPENIEHSRAIKVEHPETVASTVTTPGDLTLARTQVIPSDIQRKSPDEGVSVSQQVSTTNVIREKRQPAQVESPAITAGATLKRGSANPLRDFRKTGSASNENVRSGSDDSRMNGSLPLNVSSRLISAQASPLTETSLESFSQLLSQTLPQTLPPVQKQIASTQAPTQPPGFVWRKVADSSAADNPTASVSSANPRQGANEAAGNASTIQSPHSQTNMSEAASRTDEVRASSVTTERILRKLSRRLSIERERRGY